nr:MAG TPA: tail tube protein [Caudoviricetes sp.]
MPQYGAKMLQWAPFAETNPEPADALPNYGTPINLGGLMSVAETLNFSEVESRADDVRKIYIKEFTDGSLAVGVLELTNETASAVTGAKLDSSSSAKDIHFSADDTPPYGCLGFYTTNMKPDGTKYWKGLFYPKVKASLDGRTYNTKQKTIVLDSPTLTFAVDACATGDYRIESPELTTESAAKEWVNGKVKAAAGG